MLAVLWIVALHATLLALAFWGGGRGLVGDEYTYTVAAQRLLATGKLVLDPLWPPLYPWLLAALPTYNGSFMPSLVVAQTLLLLVAALSLRTIVSRVFGSKPAGRYAAFMMLGYPTLVAFTGYVWPEIVYLAMFLAACAILVKHPQSILAACAAGVLLGVALLCKLVLWPFLPLVVLPLVVAQGRGSKQAAALVCVIATGLVIVSAPILRPDGGAARVDTNIAFNVNLGLQDTSRRTFVASVAGREYRAYVASADNGDERTSILWTKVADLVSERGVFAVLGEQLSKQYLRLFDPESFFTAQLAGGELDASPSGYRRVPAQVAALLRALTWGCYLAMLGLAVIGVAVRPWQNRSKVEQAWMAVFAAFFLYNMAIFLVLHVVSRYRIVLLPGFFFFAAAALDRVRPQLTDS